MKDLDIIKAKIEILNDKIVEETSGQYNLGKALKLIHTIPNDRVKIKNKKAGLKKSISLHKNRPPQFKSKISHNNKFTNSRKFMSSITDETRGSLLKINNLITDNPKIKKLVTKELTRKVLYLGSENPNLSKIEIEKEFKSFKKILTDEYIELKKIEKPNIENLIETWEDFKPTVLFISCHGDELGVYLEDNDGKPKHINNTDLINFFIKRLNYTKCVVLSSCQSLNLGKLITQYGKKVICINNQVSINTTKRFNELFFKYINSHSLAYDSMYEKAFNQTMEIIGFEGLKDTFSFEFLNSKTID